MSTTENERTAAAGTTADGTAGDVPPIPSFFDPATQDDPFDAYALMRAHCPVHQLPENGTYVISRYDVDGVLNTLEYCLTNSLNSIGNPSKTGNVGGDPLLYALANYGGPTETHRLLKVSPAIDAGDPLELAIDHDGEGLFDDHLAFVKIGFGNHDLICGIRVISVLASLII